MKVFISWSGYRSRELAAALTDWLPNVINAVEPFFSEDMDKGIDWMSEITGELTATAFGIVCLTPENSTAPWLLFEAGALFKALPGGKQHVVPIALGFSSKGDIKPPLSSLNGMLAEKSDFLGLVKTINKFAKPSLDDARLENVFEKWWRDLEVKIEAILEQEPPTGPAPSERTVDDKLDELLQITRSLASKQTLDPRIYPDRVRGRLRFNAMGEVVNPRAIDLERQPLPGLMTTDESNFRAQEVVQDVLRKRGLTRDAVMILRASAGEVFELMIPDSVHVSIATEIKEGLARMFPYIQEVTFYTRGADGSIKAFGEPGDLTP